MAVKSRCVEVYAFDSKTGLCIGCFRTRDEIRDWEKLTDRRRHQILNGKSRRRAKMARGALMAPAES
ncbi:DUF1289 domain-containing protein [Paraburkholderia sp. CNPSo 3281]|uniref:DUF1289 domain-containing protein n=1 Tax=Paraburkholderia sp. CNPSo 3281 TaxID=2940933 RepID=UPI0020B81E4B|nr:DUF1289 domain-containing protein [Paraburkholderia sp. CNPSo 3281]MCP3716241.1 DUF1289 domain-containing protein [Paraburkholderia sp. CNPSo 3281]